MALARQLMFLLVHALFFILLSIQYLFRASEHEITMDMLDDLTSDMIKELLPAVGHRIRLVQAMKLREKTTTKRTKLKRSERNQVSFFANETSQISD